MDKATSAQPGAALAIARHMARLRNFRTASQILSRVDLDELGLIDQCFAGITLLSAQDGLLADQLLARISRHSRIVPTARRRRRGWGSGSSCPGCGPRTSCMPSAG